VWREADPAILTTLFAGSIRLAATSRPAGIDRIARKSLRGAAILLLSGSRSIPDGCLAAEIVTIARPLIGSD
jgi:hypothetical protein